LLIFYRKDNYQRQEGLVERELLKIMKGDVKERYKIALIKREE
jgi:hypothetical protein